jgi:hypothetical protein
MIWSFLELETIHGNGHVLLCFCLVLTNMILPKRGGRTGQCRSRVAKEGFCPKLITEEGFADVGFAANYPE